MTKLRTDFRVGPARITSGPGLALFMLVAMVVVCGVVPCVIGTVAL